MKKLTFATIFLIATLAIAASGQVKPGATESNHAASIGPSATRVGVLGARPETTSDNVVNAANAQPRAIPDLSLVAMPLSSATAVSFAAVPEAATAMPVPEEALDPIIRQGLRSLDVNLAESNASSTLVVPGDVIKVSGMPPAPTEFFFAGGEVNSPGQKPYHSGLTLTQAILASGGCSKIAGIKVQLSRQGADGRLVTSEYNLSNIQRGEIPDPALQKGDRLEVSAAQ